MGLIDRFKSGWNAFLNRDPTAIGKEIGSGYSYRPDRTRYSRGNERSIIMAVFNRIAMDVAAIDIKHIRVDENGRFLEEIDSGLNNCLNVEANIDQTGRAFKQDATLSLLDEGCVALVPVDTDDNPEDTASFDIRTLRVGKIVDWHPQHVRILLYNDRNGQKEEVVLQKRMVSIVENPFYSIMNEPNSTLQRLIRKLNLLDAIDEQSGSGKLDLIIQLPYSARTELRRRQADERRKQIEDQLTGSKYGIAYIDSTEHITQLNRAIENNLMGQIEYLTNMLYSQLGITQSILDGTADEQTMLNYHNRTIEPIVSAITDEMKRKFLSKTARTRYQTISFSRDPFKLVPVNSISEIADKFTRNEIMTSNEIRQIIGMKPSKDPKADELRNKNLNQSNLEMQEEQIPTDMDFENMKVSEDDTPMTREEYQRQLADLDKLDSQLSQFEDSLDEDDELKHYASPYYDPVKAHEYYMKNRELKGRKSTAGLNDTGKETASYVRKTLMDERNQKIADHKKITNDRIADVRDATKFQIGSLKDTTKSNVAAINDKTKSNLKSLKEQNKSAIESHKNEMQSKIDSLKDMYNQMSKEEKAEKRQSVKDVIASLREDNKNVRKRLQAEYKSLSTVIRSDSKDAKKKVNDEYKESRTSLSNENKDEAKSLRSEHKEEKTRLKDEYEQKYISELEKMQNDSSLQRVYKRKKKSK